MTYDYTGRVALITGGGSGLGRAIAYAYAACGAAVAVSDINQEGAAETAQTIIDKGGQASAAQVDVVDRAAVAAWVNDVHQTFGRIDFAINNAGIEGDMMSHRLADASYDMYRRVMDINVNGVWHSLEAELPIMEAQGEGVIINVASIAGLVAVPRNAAYAASKHAVIGITKTVALEYVRKGIRINAICPGFTDTPMVRRGIDHDEVFAKRLLAGIPARRLGRPEDVAETVMYMSSKGASFMVGECLVLDGGIHAA